MQTTNTQPLDDRDVIPWEETEEAQAQVQADRNHFEDSKERDEDQAAYKQEREDERLDAYFAPSEPW